MKWGLLGWTVLAFLLAMGVGAHALDELKGGRCERGSRIASSSCSPPGRSPARARSASTSRIDTTLWLLAFVVFGAAIVVAYNLELFGGALHTPLWFAGAWGAFPVLTGYFASAQRIRLDAVAAAAFGLVTSLAQQRLSTDVRAARRQAGDASLARTAEQALQLLAAAMPLLAGALLLARWLSSY